MTKHAGPRGGSPLVNPYGVDEEPERAPGSAAAAAVVAMGAAGLVVLGAGPASADVNDDHGDLGSSLRSYDRQDPPDVEVDLDPSRPAAVPEITVGPSGGFPSVERSPAEQPPRAMRDSSVRSASSTGVDLPAPPTSTPGPPEPVQAEPLRAEIDPVAPVPRSVEAESPNPSTPITSVAPVVEPSERAPVSVEPVAVAPVPVAPVQPVSPVRVTSAVPESDGPEGPRPIVVPDVRGLDGPPEFRAPGAATVLDVGWDAPTGTVDGSDHGAVVHRDGVRSEAGKAAPVAAPLRAVLTDRTSTDQDPGHEAVGRQHDRNRPNADSGELTTARDASSTPLGAGGRTTVPDVDAPSPSRSADVGKVPAPRSATPSDGLLGGRDEGVLLAAAPGVGGVSPALSGGTPSKAPAPEAVARPDPDPRQVAGLPELIDLLNPFHRPDTRIPEVVDYLGSGAPNSQAGSELRIPTGDGTGWEIQIRPTTTWLPNGTRIIEWPDYPGAEPRIDVDSGDIIIEIDGEIPAPVGVRRRTLAPLIEEGRYDRTSADPRELVAGSGGSSASDPARPAGPRS